MGYVCPRIIARIIASGERVFSEMQNVLHSELKGRDLSGL
jgi:hypothetical protein